MLLTFKKIRNESGAGNKIFDQATRALVDMDVAMTHGNSTSESLSKTAIRLGKALNDPVKGATALKRVGVDLDEAQKKQIATFVKSGDVMAAQKVILKELTSEFGGSAEALGTTFAGKINILRESLRNLGAELLSKLVPSFSAPVVTWSRLGRIDQALPGGGEVRAKSSTSARSSRLTCAVEGRSVR